MLFPSILLLDMPLICVIVSTSLLGEEEEVKAGEEEQVKAGEEEEQVRRQCQYTQ